jgi:multiple sugar transport system substrate-binding protein
MEDPLDFHAADGGDYVSKDLKTAQFTSEEVGSAVRFWFDWATKYKIVDPNSMT